MTSAACGCHNNVNANGSNANAVPFSKPDTLVNGLIVKRVEAGAIVPEWIHGHMCKWKNWSNLWWGN